MVFVIVPILRIQLPFTIPQTAKRIMRLWDTLLHFITFLMRHPCSLSKEKVGKWNCIMSWNHAVVSKSVLSIQSGNRLFIVILRSATGLAFHLRYSVLLCLLWCRKQLWVWELVTVEDILLIHRSYVFIAAQSQRGRFCHIRPRWWSLYSYPIIASTGRLLLFSYCKYYYHRVRCLYHDRHHGDHAEFLRLRCQRLRESAQILPEIAETRSQGQHHFEAHLAGSQSLFVSWRTPRVCCLFEETLHEWTEFSRNTVQRCLSSDLK